jgi:hypothetical protein
MVKIYIDYIFEREEIEISENVLHAINMLELLTAESLNLEDFDSTEEKEQIMNEMYNRVYDIIIDEARKTFKINDSDELDFMFYNVDGLRDNNINIPSHISLVANIINLDTTYPLEFLVKKTSKNEYVFICENGDKARFNSLDEIDFLDINKLKLLQSRGSILPDFDEL